MSSERPGQPAFQAYIELLQAFLAHRDAVVERIQTVLAALPKSAGAVNRSILSRQFEDCFFATPVTSREQQWLRGKLLEAHWAEGFRPRDMPGIPNEMFDPAELIQRAQVMWHHTRWPGRNGRVRFAHTLFNLYLVRCLALLTMRVWDEGEGAAARLGLAQQVLERLWQGSPADQPVLVRDVRWLVPVAQSPTTDALGPYFARAEQVASQLPAADRLDIHKAAVVMAGGHLRSQLRHFTMQGKSFGDHSLLLDTRRSNALDCAMTLQGLVPLLAAYEHAANQHDARQRLELASVICQGISPDPDLFVNRLDLLSAYSMVEHLFTQVDAGRVVLTPTGLRHQQWVAKYAASIRRVVGWLREDVAHFAPVEGSYSPYGVMYGFSSNLLEHMTMKALQPEAEIRFSLEDVFLERGEASAKLAWVSGWRRLPHIGAEVQKLYAYPQQFAQQIFARIVKALGANAGGGEASPARGTLFVMSADLRGEKNLADAAELPLRYVLSSDPAWVRENRASACDGVRLLADRNEGEFLVSFETTGGWVAVSKDALTDVLGAGRDASLGHLPPAALEVLLLLYPDLVEKKGG